MSSRLSVKSMPKTEIPPFVGELAQAVESCLARIIDTEQSRWVDAHPDLGVVFDEIRGLALGGGKRIRPAFCLLGALVSNGSQSSEVVRAGAALELLHAMALFHDDVIDGSLSRRGRETTHVRQTRLHRDSSWAGDASRFGDGVAILVGDLAYVLADQLMEPMNARVRDVWSQMRIEVNIGQYLDVVGSARRDFTAATAARIALFKTAKYTVERPLHIGSLIADPSTGQPTLDVLSGVGVLLGIAFQMRDDVLGVFGEPNVTGKPAGDDLRESKPTALVAAALSAATPEQRAVLGRIGSPDLDVDAIDAMRQVIVDTGALAETEARIRDLVDEAIEGLGALSLRDDVKTNFVDLAHAVAWRDA
jgi:geranylgeranyl diphosphate synthase type I